MAIPRMPWYGAVERNIRPIEPAMGVALLALAAVTVVIALRGDAVLKTAWFVYLVSP